MKFAKIQIALFIILLMGPAVAWFFIGAYMNQENTENRKLASMPEFSFQTIAQYPQSFDNYYNDHLPFKGQMVETYAYVDLKVFGCSLSQEVVIGKDGWLFYNGSGNPIASYKGIDAFSQIQMKKIADNLIKARDQLEEQGIEFVLYLAPNKEEVYSEFMPDYIKRFNDDIRVNRCDKLVEYLQENTDIKVIFPKAKLLERKGEADLYYHQDTHWNAYGGFIGVQELVKSLNLPAKEFDEVKIEQIDKIGGDLDNIAKIGKFMPPDVDYSITDYSDYTVKNLESNFYDTYRFISDNPNGKRLLVQRDSFATAMMPFTAPHFAESVWVHVQSFTSDRIESERPDIFVLELAERNLPTLLDYNLD